MPPEWNNPDPPTDLDVGLAAAFGPAVSVAEQGEGSSVLAALEQRLGAESRIYLRDEEKAGAGEPPTPIDAPPPAPTPATSCSTRSPLVGWVSSSAAATTTWGGSLR